MWTSITISGDQFEFRPGGNALPGTGRDAAGDGSGDAAYLTGPTPLPGIVPEDPGLTGSTMAIGEEDDMLSAPHVQNDADLIGVNDGAPGSGDAGLGQAAVSASPDGAPDIASTGTTMAVGEEDEWAASRLDGWGDIIGSPDTGNGHWQDNALSQDGLGHFHGATADAPDQAVPGFLPDGGWYDLG